MAISKRNLRTTRPTAPRWKAHIEIYQKASQQRVSVVQGEGLEVACTRAIKVKVPGKHFSGLTPSEQKALYVRLRSVHEKRISLYFTVHSVWAGGPHSNSLSAE
eukprot:scaffold61728_cov39-Phaeocystis_antarctica.AAC.1